MPLKFLVDTDSTQTMTNKTLTAPIITSGTISLAAAPTATLDAATKGYVDGLNTTPLVNGSVAATVSSNALTIHLKTAGGSTPSSSDPVRVTFRSSTDTDGSLVTRTVTSATSMTFASGSTLGMNNGEARRIWVGLLDNSGTVEVCAWNPLLTDASPSSLPNTLSLKGFTPNTDVTTTAEGSGTATSAHVLYSTNARSTVPFVLLGFIEISEATAGVWASAPSVVQTYRTGYRKTGDIVQICMNQTGEVATGTTTLPSDDTIPQITEGNEFMTQAITPTSSLNLLRIRHEGSYGSSSTNALISAAIFQDATSNALATRVFGRDSTANSPAGLVITYVMLAGTTSSTTLRLRAGTNAAGTTTFNGTSAAREYGGSHTSSLSVEEIYV
jgi:hypothetical protein